MKFNSYILFTLGICALLILPGLFSDGMFMDAMMYTSVGRNLAEGVGTFWFPHFTDAHMASPSFHENPPLGYGLMAVYFYILGDHWYTERIYILTTLLMGSIAIVKFWKMLFPAYSKQSWLAVLLWVITPTVYWTYQQNMMENTMTIFILWSIIYAYKSAISVNRTVKYDLYSALFICAAFMTKGIPGLFVWSAPFIFAITTHKNYKKAAYSTITMMGVCLLFGLFLYFYEPARESMRIYLFERTSVRLEHGATTSNRFTIILDLFENLLIPVGMITLILLLSRMRVKTNWSKTTSALLLLGLAGTIPFSLSHVQRGFYLVPIYPLFAVAFASILAPIVDFYQETNRLIWSTRIVAVATFTVGMVLMWNTWGEPKRDGEILHDTSLLDELINNRCNVRVRTELNQNGTLVAYMQRYAKLTLNDRDLLHEPYYQLVKKGELPDELHLKSHPISEKLILFDLYQK